MGNLYAQDLTIIPLKKPLLNKKIEEQKLSQAIIKPKPKPTKKIKETETKVVEKKVKKINFLIPKNKPLVVKKTSTAVKTTSKYYSKRDFDLAKRSIKAMEKRQWSSALEISKKARDKSIHDFIQWSH